MEIPNGLNTWVPGKDLDACIDLAFREWFYDHKQDVKDYFIHLRDQKASFFHANGMSVGGDMRYKLEIPVKLAGIIQRMTHKDWVHDTQIHKAIQRQASKFAPTEKSEAFVDFGKANV